MQNLVRKPYFRNTCFSVYFYLLLVAVELIRRRGVDQALFKPATGWRPPVVQHLRSPLSVRARRHPHERLHGGPVRGGVGSGFSIVEMGVKFFSDGWCNLVAPPNRARKLTQRVLGRRQGRRRRARPASGPADRGAPGRPSVSCRKAKWHSRTG